jgi:glycosyltransferase involved in cell wall biosynthesis
LSNRTPHQAADAAKPAADAQPTVSVVMATHNRAHFLPQALDSLIGQTRVPDEILVVDDASTDETARVLAGYGPRIKTITLKVNRGKPAAINLALGQAIGTHIWLFDDDDVALPDALADHLVYLASHPNIDFTCSDKYLFEVDGDIWNKAHWRIQPMAGIQAETFLFRTLLSMNTLMQGMLVSARCYQAVGGFDPQLARSEDHDMVLRLARGFKVGNLGKPTFVYRQHAGARGAGAEAHGAQERFKILLAYRQIIFQRLREQWPLALFFHERNPELSGPCPELSGLEQGQALVRRACIMLRQVLIEEALADLDAGLDTIAAHGGQLGAAGDLLTRALDIEPWTWPGWPRDLRAINAVLARHHVPGIRPLLARGLYWNARRDFDKKAYRQAAMSALMFGYFGLSGFANAVSGSRFRSYRGRKGPGRPAN